MERKLSKKSQGHIEVILSFIIFIGAMLFILFYINPAIKSDDRTNIDEVTQKVISNTSLNIGKLVIVPLSNKECYYLEGSNYPPYFTETVNPSPPDDPKEFRLYFTTENGIFLSNTPHRDFNPNRCEEEKDYTLGVYTEDETIVYSKIVDFKNRYDGDYELLRQKLEISNGFSFEIKNMNGVPITQLSVNRPIPGNVNVNAREFPIRIIDQDGMISEFLFHIKVW